MPVGRIVHTLSKTEKVAMELDWFAQLAPVVNLNFAAAMIDFQSPNN